MTREEITSLIFAVETMQRHIKKHMDEAYIHEGTKVFYGEAINNIDAMIRRELSMGNGVRALVQQNEGMTEQNLKDLRTIKDYYTYDTQSRQAVEEMAELIQAINKFWRKEMNCGYDMHEDDKDKNYREHIAEEIADVYICLKQMEMFLDIEGDVKGFIDYKIDRQLNRIVNNK